MATLIANQPRMSRAEAEALADMHWDVLQALFGHELDEVTQSVRATLAEDENMGDDAFATCAFRSV